MMIERYRIWGFEGDPERTRDPNGAWVLFSDYEALESRCRELEAERDRQYDENVNRIAAEGAALLRAEKAEAEVARLTEALAFADKNAEKLEALLEPHIAWGEAALAADASPAQNRPCTCHPNDNPPQPCPEKYAYSDCVEAAQIRDEVLEEAARIAEEDHRSEMAKMAGYVPDWLKYGTAIAAAIRAKGGGE